jgi:hypothetical protein
VVHIRGARRRAERSSAGTSHDTIRISRLVMVGLGSHLKHDPANMRRNAQVCADSEFRRRMTHD